MTKETICTRCVHRPVCSYMDMYVKLVNNMDDRAKIEDDVDIRMRLHEGTFSVSVTCRHYCMSLAI